ncbi:hypothetical protein V6N12_024155 [Hibiscus sabdariffa]|uniref:DUF3444 domain-containing protein n=1 Tax=Hibiscus sabdariffa TaxID=183260 RepID=A0ABR2FZR1_9ROSI
MNEIQDRASSVILLNLRWKEMENVLDSAQTSVEERLREAISREDELKKRTNKIEEGIERREKFVKDRLEELKVKEEELGRQFRDLELGKKNNEEMLREVELKQKQLEGLKLKEEEFVLKEKGLERQLKNLEFSVEQCEQQRNEVKLLEKMVKDKLEEIGLKEKDLENCLRECGLKEEQFVLKEESLGKRCMEFELKEKALEERRRDLEFSVKQCEQQREEVKLMEKLVKEQLEEVGLKEKDLEKCLKEYELKEEQFGLKEKILEKHCMEFELEDKAFKERCRDLEVKVKQYEQDYKRLEVTEKRTQQQLEEIKRKEEEFGLKERDFGQRCRDVVLSENCLQKGLKDLELKSEQCEERFREVMLMEESVSTQSKLIKEKEEQFRLKMNHLEQLSRDLTMKETSLEKSYQDLEEKQKYNEDCLREVELKEKQLEESSDDLGRKYKLQFEDVEYKVKQCDKRFMELMLKEKLVKDQFEQIEAKEQQLGLKESHFEQRLKDFELKEKGLELHYQELGAKEKHCDECLRKLKLRGKEIEELSAERRRKYDQQSSDLEFNVKKCEQQFKDLKSKEKKLVEWSKELERKRSLASALHAQVEWSTKIAADAPLGAMTTVSSNELASNHLKGSKQAKQKVHGFANVIDKGVDMPIPDAAPKGLGSSRITKNKRIRKLVDKSDESFETGSETETGDAIGHEDCGNNSGLNSKANAGCPPRKSSRQKQHISYAEKSIDGDIVSSPWKRSKVTAAPKTNEKKVDDYAKKKDNSVVPTVVSVKCPKEVTCKASKAGESKGKEAEPVNKIDKLSPVNCGSDVKLSPQEIEYPEPEFSDFEKQRAENCFAVNQVWAMYDTLDGMPRFYAWINKVFNPGFKLQITWLEPYPDEKLEQNWVDLDLPVCCGKYYSGYTETCVDRLMFSHRIDPIKSFGKCFLVYPKKGEIWALFRDWDINWISEPENHKPSCRYDFVEVLTDFDEEAGIVVSHVGKVKGFVSIFRQTARYGVLSFKVSPRELYRFSHQIPSFKMTGKERDVPVGSFELDPASVPPNLDELVDPGDDLLDCNLTQTEGNSTSIDAFENTNTQKMCERNGLSTDCFKPRRSPRDLSRKGHQVNV